MQIKPLALGGEIIKNNIFLAPMAGYTDYAIRKLQLSLGVGLAFTELASAKGIIYGGGSNKELLKATGDEDKTAVQLFGADENFMRSACESEQLSPFKIVDINMGCPVPKVFKNGEGSALLLDIKKAEKIISECVKSGKIITVKIRTGQKKGDDIATEFTKMAEGAGASLVTIHGRVREDYYSGEPDFKAIESAKNSVKIPVIANGGIFTLEDANNMMDKTGADGVMLARGAMANPFLICELLGKTPTLTLKEYIVKHIEYMKETYPEKKATLEFRKFPSYYFKGMLGLKEIKTALQTAESTEKILEIINAGL